MSSGGDVERISRMLLCSSVIKGLVNATISTFAAVIICSYPIPIHEAFKKSFFCFVEERLFTKGAVRHIHSVHNSHFFDFSSSMPN